mmetsp:Transcript_538/g.974  ORF Transcript_538/g.974 Transcript_538/m.974 type:complete len:567 (+) Transcript_538:100-1800(+)|eukprot:CAMPEP_0201681226 /NCGR_PEP_ID=MMETSP0494-20130426/51001_1 /ASSEMBLY_ACC=CAM_ASM_000839 /TAXON_ID=420259 /ORGANISM="Thalassiosira gravida, Strain GMp14c1" /LENGTH=566 /DNA_ID=CAMNT_0048164963 /DNA_START=89 /DNA_END=1789 /DNA_ORIENTATION=+
MSNDDGKNDLFGDSSSDADTDDLIAAAKSQPIARKKEGAAPKKKAAKKTPDADADSDGEGGGLFDSDSEDDEESGPKKKQLGKKRKGGGSSSKMAKKKKPAAKKGPLKKDTRSMKERMEALAKKRSGGSGGGSGDGEKEGGSADEPRKKRSKPDKDGKESGYKSGDSYDSVNVERTKDDDDFIDTDDEDADARKELYSEQHFDDERPDGYDSEEEKKMKKQANSRKSQGAGLDKISLSDDEGDEGECASSALKAAVRRMQRKKKEKKSMNDLEEEATEFLKAMDAAADADATSIAKRRPAVKRLAMLQRVMDTLAKKDLVRVMLDQDLLSVCKRWVQPLPNGSLGNVTLRRRIIEAICNMTGENGINAEHLKRSGFGKVVMTLYMHRHETPEMKKMLKGAIEQWSRPIFQKSGNMRDLERAQAARGIAETGSLVGIARAQQFDAKQEERRRSGGGSGGRKSKGRGKNEDDLAQIITKGSKNASEVGNNRVRIPYSKGFQYSVRPENRTGNIGDKRNLVSAKSAMGGGGMVNEKRDALSKRMIEKNRASNKQNQRSANISIEGRAVK